MTESGITIEQAIDLGYATLKAFKQDAVEIALNHQTYEVVNRWFSGDKKSLDGGKKVTWDLTLKDTGNGAHVNDYEPDTPNVANVCVEAEANWVHYKNNFSYSMKELAMNLGNKTRIFNLFKNRRMNCARETADDLEEAAWKTPSSSTDTRAPIGIPGWICQADTSAVTGAFEGYLPDYTTPDDEESGFSTIGGLACSSTVNDKWANWYANHGDNLGDPLMKILRRAFRKTKFQTPRVAGQAIDPKSDFSNFRLYTNSVVLDEIEELATKSDDNIGYDFGKYAGSTIFKGIPFMYVDTLDDELTYVYGKNPIFGVNHNHFHPVILANENFRWNKPMTKVGQHNVFTVYLDVSYAYVCDNRRHGGFLISNWEGKY
jgi:hypothetical protein